MKRKPILACLLAATVATSACSTAWLPSFLRPYRPDVQQGNIVTKDMVEQLRTGMTRDQVRFLLGTPMLTDIFHQNRWDYPYYLRRGNGESQLRKLTVVFADGKLARFESDAMPTEPLADSMILGRKTRTATRDAAAAGSDKPAADAPAPAAPPTPAAPPAEAPKQ